MYPLLTPAQLIQNLLENSPADQRATVLRLALWANERQLARLDDEHLQATEKGWEDYWQERHTRTTETLAEIKQALAAC